MAQDDRYSCDQVLRRLDDFVDRALGPEELRRVEEHLTDCVMCAEAARFEATLIAGIRSRLQRIAVPSSLRDAIHARLTDSTHRDDRPRLPSGGP